MRNADLLMHEIRVKAIFLPIFFYSLSSSYFYGTNLKKFLW